MLFTLRLLDLHIYSATILFMQNVIDVEIDKRELFKTSIGAMRLLHRSHAPRGLAQTASEAKSVQESIPYRQMIALSWFDAYKRQ